MVKSESEARNRSLEMNLDLSRFFDDVHACILKPSTTIGGTLYFQLSL
jgi:hypothetical protein